MVVVNFSLHFGLADGERNAGKVAAMQASRDTNYTDLQHSGL